MGYYKEQDKILPENLVFGYPLNSDPEDYSDRQSFWISLNKKEKCLTFYDGSKTVSLDSPEKVFNLIEEKRYTLLVTDNPNLPSWLWISFPKDFQIFMNLYIGHSQDYDYKWTVMPSSPTKTNFYNHVFPGWHTLVVLSSPNAKKAISSDEVVKQYLDDLYPKTGIIPSLTSFSATGRRWLFGDSLREFQVVQEISKTNREALEGYYSACKRPLMAAEILGDIPPCINEDSVKAFLKALENAPSKDKYHAIQDTSPCYDPDALYAYYLVRAKIEPLWGTCPNLFRGGDDSNGYGIYPATGSVIENIGQVRAKLWTALGIKFKVLKAHKMMPYTTINFPFRKRALWLRWVIDSLGKDFNTLYLKSLYQSGIGSLLTMYPTQDLEGKESWSALFCFDPMLQSFIYEWTDCMRWLRASSHPRDKIVAHRIDAITTLEYPTYRRDPKGLFVPDSEKPVKEFFPNPRNKDKDLSRNARYRDATKEAADRGEEEVYIPGGIVSPSMVFNGDAAEKDLGKLLKIRLNLGGELKIVQGKEKVLPKDLIENQLHCIDPTAEQVKELQSKLPESIKYGLLN